MEFTSAVAAKMAREVRLSQGWSQQRMAEALGTKQPVISMIERDTPGKGFTAPLCRAMLGLCVPDSIEHEFFSEYLQHLPGYHRTTSALPRVSVVLPDAERAPQLRALLSSLGQVSADQMTQLTDADFKAWLYQHFFATQDQA